MDNLLSQIYQLQPALIQQKQFHNTRLSQQQRQTEMYTKYKYHVHCYET